MRGHNAQDRDLQEAQEVPGGAGEEAGLRGRSLTFDAAVGALLAEHEMIRAAGREARGGVPEGEARGGGRAIWILC
jgi:hypothetical protein